MPYGNSQHMSTYGVSHVVFDMKKILYECPASQKWVVCPSGIHAPFVRHQKKTKEKKHEKDWNVIQRILQELYLSSLSSKSLQKKSLTVSLHSSDRFSDPLCV